MPWQRGFSCPYFPLLLAQDSSAKVPNVPSRAVLHHTFAPLHQQLLHVLGLIHELSGCGPVLETATRTLMILSLGGLTPHYRGQRSARLLTIFHQPHALCPITLGR